MGELARELGAKKVLLVTDAGIVAAGHAERVRRLLTDAGVKVSLFGKARENPTTRDVNDCLRAAKSAGINAILGLGGGSSMDTAKGCNFILTNGGRMQDYWGVGKATKPMLPMIAIPTTAGTRRGKQSFWRLLLTSIPIEGMACGDPKAWPGGVPLSLIPRSALATEHVVARTRHGRYHLVQLKPPLPANETRSR